MQLQPKPKKEKTLTSRLAYKLGEFLGLLIGGMILALSFIIFVIIVQGLLDILGGLVK